MPCRKAGQSTKEIAQQFGVTRRTIQRIAKEPPVEDADDAEAPRRRRVERPPAEEIRSRLRDLISADPQAPPLEVLRQLREEGTELGESTFYRLFRIEKESLPADLAEYLREHPGVLDSLPIGASAVTTTAEAEVPPGIIFCLRAEGTAAERAFEPGYPLAPHYLVHVGDDGAVLLPFPVEAHPGPAEARLRRTRPSRRGGLRALRKGHQGGEDMRHGQRLLSTAVASVVGKTAERAVASLFTPGGTHALKGEFAGSDDFEVLAYLVVPPEAEPR